VPESQFTKIYRTTVVRVPDGQLAGTNDRQISVIVDFMERACVCASMRLRILDVFNKAPLDAFQQSIVRTLPYLFVEDLNFDRSVVAGSINGLSQLS
jgi:hypothetical protein